MGRLFLILISLTVSLQAEQFHPGVSVRGTLNDRMNFAKQIADGKKSYTIQSIKKKDNAVSYQDIEHYNSLLEAKGNQNTNGISKAEINKRVLSAKRSIRRCYNQTLRKDPTARGKVVLQFSISGKGKVKTVRVRSSSLALAGDSKLKSCLVKVFRKIEFPRASRPEIVTHVDAYPVHLNQGFSGRSR